MFKDRLKELREKANLSQSMLAKKIFVSRSAIAKWENGIGIPSDANLEALCEFFQVEEDWLLDRNDLKATIINTSVKITFVVLDFMIFLIVMMFLYLTIDGGLRYYKLIKNSTDVIISIGYYNIFSKLGILSIIPLGIYLITIIGSVIDFLINFKVIIKINNKIIKFVVVISFILSIIIWIITHIIC